MSHTTLSAGSLMLLCNVFADMKKLFRFESVKMMCQQAVTISLTFLLQNLRT